MQKSERKRLKEKVTNFDIRHRAGLLDPLGTQVNLFGMQEGETVA